MAHYEARGELHAEAQKAENIMQSLGLQSARGEAQMNGCYGGLSTGDATTRSRSHARM